MCAYRELYDFRFLLQSVGCNLLIVYTLFFCFQYGSSTPSNEPRRKESNDSNQSSSTRLSSSFGSDLSLDLGSTQHSNDTNQTDPNSPVKHQEKPVIRKPLVLPKPSTRGRTSSKSSATFSLPAPSRFSESSPSSKSTVSSYDFTFTFFCFSISFLPNCLLLHHRWKLIYA